MIRRGVQWEKSTTAKRGEGSLLLLSFAGEGGEEIAQVDGDGEVSEAQTPGQFSQALG